MNIYQKLLQIQAKVNGLGKDASSGSGNYGYQYVSGAKVLEFVRPLMNELGLILKQEILSIENDRQDYTVKSGPKSEILSKVMMRFTWIDTETGEKDENLFGANGQNDWEKGLGSALTYAERYFLLKFFHIPTDEDDIDNDLRKKIDEENLNKPNSKSTQAPASANNERTAWLNENDPNWKRIEKWISAGKKPTLQQIKDTLKVAVSKKTAEALKNKYNIQ
ncbi:ERF family protein [Riemerella anatipestifer]|nr:ERF family protein [Riemerella anatipestifer]MDY3357507.1 ERF family protein [Riemerella anatipestifer]